MYELIILSLLMRGPIHGYLIAKIIDDLIGPVAKVSHGWLYPRLAKLEQEGLIGASLEAKQEHQGDRQLHTYEITEAGRKRFHQLMMGTAKNLVEGEMQYHTMDLAQLEATLHVLRRSISQWQVDLEYANSLREKEMARALTETSVDRG
jgi:DNA-binding PadR family transcriptional regulator